MLHLFLLVAIAFASVSDITCNSGYCTSCDDNGCTGCIEGYVLINNTCVFFETAHCSYYSTTSDERICSICDSGYVLTNNNECIECPNLANCASVDGLTCSDECNDCRQFAYKKDGECVYDDVHCGAVDDQGNCTYCYNFYYLDEETGSCLEGQIENCQIYADNETCTTCLNNLMFDTDSKQCVECGVDHCITCQTNNATECSECDGPYTLSDDKTICFQCVADGCITCDNSDPTGETCKECEEDGYLFYNAKCYKCISNCDDCVYSSYQTTCTECSYGYITGTGIEDCLPCPDNCDKCHKDSDTGDVLCDRCSYDGLVNGNGVITYYGYYGLDENYTSCDYQLEDCELYDSSNPQTCYSCVSGFMYDSENNVCVDCETDHCSKCYSTTTTPQCTDCKDGYQYLGGSGDVPYSCYEKNITHCSSYSTTQSYKCLSCDTNYFTNTDNDACVTCLDSIPNCETCTSDSVCTQCSDLFYLEDATCKSCINHCNICDGDTGECSSCDAGYVLNENADECLPCPDNCDTCDNSDTGLCQTCSNGFFITESYTCSSCSVSCESDIIIDTTITDVVCNDAQYTCQVNNEHCVRLSSDGSECIECESGYSLDDLRCYAYSVGSVGNDGNDYVCLLYSANTEEFENGESTSVFSPVEGTCENPLPTIESSSSTTSGSTSESGSTTTSESNSNNNNDGSDGAFMIEILAIFSLIVLLL
ncbi:Furin repeat-containing protein [Entamoeba marina]